MAVYYVKELVINNYSLNKFTINGVKYSFGKQINGYTLINTIIYKGDTYIYKEDFQQTNTDTTNNFENDQQQDIQINNSQSQSRGDLTEKGIHLFYDNTGAYKIQYRLSQSEGWKDVDVYKGFSIGTLLYIKCVTYSPMQFNGWRRFTNSNSEITVPLTEKLVRDICSVYKQDIFLLDLSLQQTVAGFILDGRGPYKLNVGIYPQKAGNIIVTDPLEYKTLPPTSAGLWTVPDDSSLKVTAIAEPGYKFDHWEINHVKEEILYNDLGGDGYKIHFGKSLTCKSGAYNPLTYQLSHIHRDLSYTAIFSKDENFEETGNTLGFSNDYQGEVSIFDLIPHVYYSIDRCHTWIPIKNKGYYNNTFLRTCLSYPNPDPNSKEPRSSTVFYRVVFTHNNSMNFSIKEKNFVLARVVPIGVNLVEMYSNWTASEDINTTYKGYTVPETWQVWEPHLQLFYSTDTEADFFKQTSGEVQKKVAGHDYVFWNNYLYNEDYQTFNFGGIMEGYALLKTDENKNIYDNLNNNHLIPDPRFQSYPDYDPNDSYEPSAYYYSKILQLVLKQSNTFKYWRFNTPKTDYLTYTGSAADKWIPLHVVNEGFIKYNITGGTKEGVRGKKYELDFSCIFDLDDTEHWYKDSVPLKEMNPDKLDPRQWYKYYAKNIVEQEVNNVLTFPVYGLSPLNLLSNIDSRPKLSIESLMDSSLVANSNTIIIKSSPWVFFPGEAVLFNANNPGEQQLWRSSSFSDFTVTGPKELELSEDGYVVPLSSAYNGIYTISCQHEGYTSSFQFTVDIQ